ncbi:MAG: DUF2867 domain-containing protein [Actinomycetota bacterium]|nr:DUF2867 domain-containing protein [Actinomycetota bacterium]
MIARIAPDFRLLDAWALPAQGGAEEFGSLLEMMASLDPANAESAATRALFAVRLRVGGWLGWDDPTKKRAIPGSGETTLGARLPEDVRGSARDPAIGGALQRAAGGFVPLYRTEREWAAELSNATVHAVLHLGWVDQGDGLFQGQLGIYVKPRGRLGEAYLMLIAPFRHLIVYPALMRQIGRAWDARSPA